MKSSVNLQDPLSYAVWPVILTGLILVLCIATLVVIKLVAAKNKKPPVVVKKPFVDVNKLKLKYIRELDNIGRDFEAGKTDIRGAYQQMSMCIRKFVHAVTGIKVQNYTLGDIGGLNMPGLYNLVSEYYSPEFARKSEGDVINSLAKTRSMIEQWR